MITNVWFASNKIISTRLESRFFYRVGCQALGDRLVLLNLISNGFYAATKCKAEANGGDYEPTLAAATMSLGYRVEIKIRDNGIPFVSPLLAQSGHPSLHRTCPLSGLKADILPLAAPLGCGFF